MGFADKVRRKTENKAADKLSSAIVNSVFSSKKKKKDSGSSASSKSKKKEAAPAKEELPPGAEYNTKICPECQAVCINSPVRCPYCGADIKKVKPLTKEEFERL